MSRIGKKPVELPKGVKVEYKNQVLKVTGPKGELSQVFNTDKLAVEVKDNTIVINRGDAEDKQTKAFHGLYRALLNNMIIGVTQGYSKKLEIVGVGFKAEMKQSYLVLSVGYSHQIAFKAPDGVKVEAPSPTNILISGIDKRMVGEVASKIRSFRKPEPYQGKGIRFEGEAVRRKEGKTAGK
ncbi:MAG: 50S ribosomal protein L6 [Chloroherpetonaceae bacterium]|nr:50S ribosomal protein L6 [Chloroherpetonaceae bacterium]